MGWRLEAANKGEGKMRQNRQKVWPQSALSPLGPYPHVPLREK